MSFEKYAPIVLSGMMALSGSGCTDQKTQLGSAEISDAGIPVRPLPSVPHYDETVCFDTQQEVRDFIIQQNEDKNSLLNLHQGKFYPFSPLHPVNDLALYCVNTHVQNRASGPLYFMKREELTDGTFPDAERINREPDFSCERMFDQSTYPGSDKEKRFVSTLSHAQNGTLYKVQHCLGFLKRDLKKKGIGL